MGLGHALFQVFHAKQIAARFCSHVSDATDIGIVWQHRKPFFLSEEDIAKLHKIDDDLPPLTLPANAIATLEEIAKKSASAY